MKIAHCVRLYPITLYFFVLAFLTAAMLVRFRGVPTALSGHLPITVPYAATTGETITVTVGPVQVTNGTPVGLVLVGFYGPNVYQSVFKSGIAEFTIPLDYTGQPGYLALIAAADNARGQASILLLNQEASSIKRPDQLVEVTAYQMD